MSSASIWEIGLKVKKKQLHLGCSLGEYCERLYSVGIQIEAITERDWIESLNLEWEHRDPVDRLVVALASRDERPLVTADREIRAFYSKTIW